MTVSVTTCEHNLSGLSHVSPHDAWAEAMTCRTCARHVLKMLLGGRSWVTRRVERVRFCDDRAATRSVSMDFSIPSEAPRLIVGTTVVRLVPLTIMRRKTLVNFGLTDMDGRSLSLMSMRHTQALTREMIMVLAEGVPTVRDPGSVGEFADAVAFGDQNCLKRAWADAHDAPPGTDLAAFLDDPAVHRMVRRLADNFFLLVAIPEDGPIRRVVRFSYDEPLALTYKVSRFDPDTQTLGRVGKEASLRSRLSSMLGWSPTTIRFPVPMAEYTRSYHFEIEAPPGALITEASLVAGRPGASGGPPSWDHVSGGLPVVGLHAVEVPNGSISGVQVRLKPSSRGWLFTNALAALLAFALLGAITINSVATDNQFQVITGAIFAISAAFIVFVVQPGEHQMVSRLVSIVRYAIATLVGLLILAGLTMTFLDRGTHWPFWIFSLASLPCTVVIVVAFTRARRRDRCPHISPWEQGIGIDAVGQTLDETTFANLEQAHRRFGFDKPAVMVQTAEAEHLEEPWTAEIDHDLRMRVEYGAPVGT